MNIGDIFGPQPLFGRVPQPDPRDRNFRAAFRLTTAEVESPPQYRYWHVGRILDQGQTSQCVAYACGQLLEAGPVRNDVLNDQNAARYLQQLYHEIQLRDDWPGEEPLYYGTSVRAGMQVLQDRGFITDYVWAWDVDTIIAWMGSTGPVDMGTDWNEGMMGQSATSAKTGFIEPTGRVVGGHSYLLVGYNLEKRCPDGTRGAVRIVNSWGENWMEGGRAWMSFASLSVLLDRWAEAAMSHEIRFLEADRP